MPPNIAKIMADIAELQTVTYGKPAEGIEGLVPQVGRHDAILVELKDIGRKIVWLLIAGGLMAFGNILLTSRNTIATEKHAQAALVPIPPTPRDSVPPSPALTATGN